MNDICTVMRFTLLSNYLPHEYCVHYSVTALYSYRSWEKTDFWPAKSSSGWCSRSRYRHIDNLSNGLDMLGYRITEERLKGT